MRMAVTIVLTAILTFLGVGCGNITGSKDGHSKTLSEEKSYPNSELLVSTGFLKNNLGKPGVAIIDARKSGYGKGHIPGAVHMNWKDYTNEAWNLKTVDQLEKQLGLAGFTRDMTFVIYDDSRISRGAAGRIFWMLEFLGCEDAHILNGGWDLWLSSKGRVETASGGMPKAVFKADVRTGIKATTDHIAGRFKDADFALVDSRTDEEFNGWRFHKEARGGHIPGAAQIPFEWLYEDGGAMPGFHKLKNFFEMRGVTRNKEVVVYSTAGIRSGFAYFALRLLGYPRVSNYDGSIYAWSSDPSMKMERLAHYEKFVSPGWVKNLMEGKNSPTYKGNGYVILESRYMKSTTTKATADPKAIGYIPGAISIHPCYFEHENNTAKYYPKYSEPVDGNLLPPDRLRKVIGNLGITKETTVVVYGSGVIIPMTTSRVAWTLMYAGVEDVRILNGGYPAWLAMGGPTTAKPGTPKAVDFGGTVPAHPEYLATMDYVQKVASGLNRESVMVDVRREKETLGELNPYPFFTARGKIPGAAWMGNWTELVDMNDSTFRCYTEVRALWNRLGVTKQREPIYYCGTGWRSSIGFYTAFAMGFDKMRNYDGSFYEWSWYPENRTSD